MGLIFFSMFFFFTKPCGISLGFEGHYWVLPSFIQFKSVVLGFLRCYLAFQPSWLIDFRLFAIGSNFEWSYLVLLGFILFERWWLPHLEGFLWVLKVITGFYLVFFSTSWLLLSFINLVLLCFFLLWLKWLQICDDFSLLFFFFLKKRNRNESASAIDQTYGAREKKTNQ